MCESKTEQAAVSYAPIYRRVCAAYLHLAIGAGVSLFALVYEASVFVSRAGIKPYSTLGWFPEHLLAGGTMLIAGFFLMLSTRGLFKVRPSIGAAVLAAEFLEIVSFAEHLRYFAPATALLSIAAPLDGLVVAQTARRQGVRFALGLFFVLQASATSTLLIAAAMSRVP